MSIVFIGLTSFFVALSGALVPGPLFTITVAESARKGFISGPLIILGHGILELSLIILIIFGLAPFFSDPAVIMVISILGGLMLVYMGYRMIREARSARISITSEQGSKGIHPILSGIIGSISNPYWTIWWATIGLGYLVSSIKLGMLGVAVFFTGHILADLLWYSLISFSVARGKRFIGEKGYRSLFYICGIFLMLFGVWFIKGM
jgi:threonine/homoserine/homoserine lactone efflux protein